MMRSSDSECKATMSSGPMPLSIKAWLTCEARYREASSPVRKNSASMSLYWSGATDALEESISLFLRNPLEISPANQANFGPIVPHGCLIVKDGVLGVGAVYLFFDTYGQAVWDNDAGSA